MAFLAALLGSALVLGSWIGYLATVPSGRVPPRPYGHLAIQSVGGLLAFAAIVSATVGGDVLRPALAGGLGVGMSGLFFFVYSQRATPIGNLRVKVGDPLRPFSASTPEGLAFDSASLKGRRVLLKFFRGHW